jgi:ATP-dependent Zn protease
MSIKKEAAFHEAAHAVTAYYSKFHRLVLEINLRNYGAGEVFVSLSRSKCLRHGKAPSAGTTKDPDVSKELAVILCSGYAGEQIASEYDPLLNPSLKSADPDYQIAVQNLKAAGVSHNLDIYNEEARISLKSKWNVVEKLAEHLFEQKKETAENIIEFIKNA